MGKRRSTSRSAAACLALAACLAAAASLSGCDTTAQINEAMPVESAVSEQWDSLLDLYSDGNTRASLEREYANRLRARALACSEGYEPWFFSSRESVRARLADSACFDESDRDLSAWISQQALKTLASLPALRPMPEEVPDLVVTSNQFVNYSFASDAGVAAIGGFGQVTEILDIDTSDTIFIEEIRKPSTILLSISPNGRLYAVRDAESAGVVIRDSTNGKALATYPGYERFQWLESDLALAQESRGQVTALDLSAGTTSVVKGVTSGNFVSLNASDPPGYVAVSGSSLIEMQVRRDEKSVNAKLVKEIPIYSQSPYSRLDPAVNGRRVVLSGGDGLILIDLAANTTRTISVAPFLVSSVLPLPEPDRFLLAVRAPQSRDGRMRYVVFLADEEKFALPTDPMFDAQNAWNMQSLFFVYSLDRLALKNAKSIKLIDSVSHGPRMTAQGLVALYATEEAPAATRLEGSTAMPAQGVGSIPQLAESAQVEAVGVYESAIGNRGFRESKPAPVRVTVRRGPKPIVLVLTSYEPVIWQITSAGAGQNIKAVLLGGYNESTVTGAGDARIVNIGRVYAYSRTSSEYSQLDQEVKRWTGKSIDMFQGSYKASMFMIGGN